MHKTLLAVGLWASTLLAAQAPAAVPWMNDVRAAHELAGQQQRLVLLHFYADWCGPCRRLDRELYPRDDVVAAISTNYVPVKIDGARFGELARQYQVDRFPTEIITDASGRVLIRTVTPAEPEQYIQLLNHIASSHRPAHPGPLVASNSTPYAHAWNPPADARPGWDGPRPADGQRTFQPQQAPHGPLYAAGPADGLPAAENRPNPHSPSVYAMEQRNPYAPAPGQQEHAAPAAERHDAWSGPGHVDNRHATSWTPPSQGTQAREASLNPAPDGSRGPNPPPSASLPEPVLALDGYCPVTLAEKEAWQLGDPRWGAVHRGRTYLFVSETNQRHFLADPDRFSPVLSGFDPQRYVDHGEVAIGQRRHGMWFRGKMYLFADEASLERFQRSPEHYAQRSHELMMRGAR